MLTIKAEGQAGDNIRESIIPDMISLSFKTGCYVEVKANDTMEMMARLERVAKGDENAD